MKQKSKYIIPVLLLLSVVFSSCSSKVNNSFTLKNMAAGAVYINFRGTEIAVPAGQTVIVKEIPAGTYQYSTTYEIPSGASTGSATGALAGDVVFKAGTKILVLYSSAFESDAYKISATISNSDDQDPTTLTSP